MRRFTRSPTGRLGNSRPAPSRTAPPTCPVGSGARGAQLVEEVRFQSIHADALLLHGVAIPHSDGAVVERLDVDADAPWCADLVLPSVELPDRSRVVVDGRELTRQPVADAMPRVENEAMYRPSRVNFSTACPPVSVKYKWLSGPTVSPWVVTH